MSKNIVRVNKNSNYTVMSNYHLRDRSLSWKAKGIHSYILSLPDDWKVIIEHLKTISTDGKDSTRSGIQELYDSRYWQRYPIFENGLICEWVTEIYEEPFEEKYKIRNIVIRNNIRTINYENGAVDNSNLYNITLVTDIPLLVENTDVDLLTDIQQVGNQQIGFAELLNTNNTKDLSSTNHSFIQKSGLEKSLKKVDGPTGEKININIDKEESKKISMDEEEIQENERMNDLYKQYDSIINNIEIDFVERRYKNAIKEAIRTLCFSDYIRVNNTKIPQQIILEDLKDLNLAHIEFALDTYKERSALDVIRNPIMYLAIIIFNSIKDIDIKIDSELRNKGIIR